MVNIVEEIFRRADARATAIVAAEGEWSFGELAKLIEAAAAALAIREGERIGLYCPNGLAHIVWSLAVLKRGGVLVPVAPELSAHERDQLVATTALRAVICADGKAWHSAAPGERVLAVPGLNPAVLCEGWTWTPIFEEAALAALDPALIRFSSGTTSRRKGVVLSHETLLARVTASNSHLGIGAGDRVIWILPMAHHFAVSIILYLLHGATTVIELSHLGADVLGAMRRSRGTVLYASPFHYAMLAALPEGEPVPDLRLAVSTAAALPAATAEKFYVRYGVPLRQALGVIECGLPLLNDQWPLEKPDSVGRPQAGYAVSIRDEAGGEVVAGTTGELFVRGPGFVDAYLSPWLTRDQILADGWFKTGDQAWIDPEGAVSLAGRSHAVINVGGMKCFPEEVEAVLAGHPGVVESRVVAMAHPTFGSVPVAEIVPRDALRPPKVSELVGQCRASLSSYKLPFKFTFVGTIPKTPSGKIQR
ncbi:MAG: class I adenylate-forming enzyme family protein [Terrimicrobiaceae bacterium]|nr:class I adenylate-forming enzyme family protein [Terrimicrobiaceae bacterium]